MLIFVLRMFILCLCYTARELVKLHSWLSRMRTAFEGAYYRSFTVRQQVGILGLKRCCRCLVNVFGGLTCGKRCRGLLQVVLFTKLPKAVRSAPLVSCNLFLFRNVALGRGVWISLPRCLKSLVITQFIRVLTG